MEKKHFLTSNYGWSLGELKRCIKENKLKSKIIFSTKCSAIVQVVSYDESVILGAVSDWCISQHKCSWDQYVKNPQGVQLFFYCFDQPVQNYNSLFGATFKVEDDVVITDCCFTRDNNPIAKVEKLDTDEEALFTTVIEPRFGDIKEELAKEIYSIHKETYKPKQKVTESKVGIDTETDGFLRMMREPTQKVHVTYTPTTYDYDWIYDFDDDIHV